MLCVGGLRGGDFLELARSSKGLGGMGGSFLPLPPSPLPPASLAEGHQNHKFAEIQRAPSRLLKRCKGLFLVCCWCCCGLKDRVTLLIVFLRKRWAAARIGLMSPLFKLILANRFNYTSK